MINKEQRILYIINCLAEHGDKRLARLYNFIELAGVDLAKFFLGSQYRSLHIIKGNEASWASFLNGFRKLKTEEKVKAVDLFFQMHGKPSAVRFIDRWLSLRKMGEELSQVADPNQLRLIYNLSCYGDSHAEMFLAAGFKASVGALKINSSAAIEYPTFCRLWAKSGIDSGKMLSLHEIVCRSDRPTVRQLQDSIAKRYFNDVDSTKVIRGNEFIKISDLPGS